MPGRTFASPADLNTQFGDWLQLANSRVVRTIKVRPLDRLDADRSAMLPLPPIALQLGWRSRVRFGRDYYVRVDSNDYSVDPTAIGRLVDVTVDLERVRVRLAGRVITEHARVWGTGSTITDAAHVVTAGLLREQFQHPRAITLDDELTRDLADYDRAFGLTGTEAVS